MVRFNFRRSLFSLAVAVIALFLPSCGGGGDAAGDNYVSPLQFANGSKGFLIPSTPNVFIYATGGKIDKNVTPEKLKETFNVNGDEDIEGWEEPVFDNSAECVFTTRAYMSFSGITPILCSVYYAVSGGKGGKGYMFVHPQDPRLSESNSDASTALINFLGCITADQAGGQAGQGQNMPGSQHVIQSMAATTLRFTFDFGTGTCTIDAITQVVKQGGGTEETIVLHIDPKAFFARPV